MAAVHLTAFRVVGEAPGCGAAGSPLHPIGITREISWARPCLSFSVPVETKRCAKLPEIRATISA